MVVLSIRISKSITELKTANLTNITPSNAVDSDYSYSVEPPLPDGADLNPSDGTITVANNVSGSFSNTYLITATVTENDPQYQGSVTGTISIKVNFSARNAHSVVEFNNELYLIGGTDGSYKNDVWKSSDGMDWEQKL